MSLMLFEFLNANRAKLAAQCQVMAATRSTADRTDEQLAYGVPLCLDQIIRTLETEQNPEPPLGPDAPAPGRNGVDLSEIGLAARLHGEELLRHGYTVEQVVHAYGDLCQAITELALADSVPIRVDEFRTLNRCLDNAIAGSVTAFQEQREVWMAERQADAFRERWGVFAHELRNFVSTATQAMNAIRTGKVGLSGPTGKILNRCFAGLHNLVDRALADTRLQATPSARVRLFSLADFIADVEAAALLEAMAYECTLAVSQVDPCLAVSADRDLLYSALTNLLQNAFKFTMPHTEVRLKVHTSGGRVLIDVEDRCGGGVPSDPQRRYRSADSGEIGAGLGLGLSICRSNVEASDGTLSRRDLPGQGCVFTIDLPRHALTEGSPRSGEPHS
jgi:signal transduction histidine kinase